MSTAARAAAVPDLSDPRKRDEVLDAIDDARETLDRIRTLSPRYRWSSRRSDARIYTTITTGDPAVNR